MERCVRTLAGAMVAAACMAAMACGGGGGGGGNTVPTRHTLAVTASGAGTGTITSSPAGIDCGATCSASFEEGTSVTLTATPAADAVFTGWEGACSGTGTCVVAASEDRAVTAAFGRKPASVSVTVSGTGTGTVTSSPGGIDCGATCTASYARGGTVTLTATPGAGSFFAGWGGACRGVDPCVLAMGEDRVVTAGFMAQFTLAVTRLGSGTGAITSSAAGIDCGSSCSAAYPAWTSVTLTATPTQGSVFVGWGGACTGTGACVVAMSEARTVTATILSYHDRPALASIRVLFGRGGDGAFGTSDDVVMGYDEVVFQPGGDSASDAWYYGVNPKGADGEWFTSDDIPGGKWTQPGSTYGWNTLAPGKDGKWFTDDDPVTTWESFGPVVGGVAINPLYDGPGGDGVWFTDDDVISGYRERTVDATYAEIRRVNYVDPGTDGEWFTADDVIDTGGYWTATYSRGNNRWLSWDRQINYSGPGKDGKWLTSDDVVGSCYTHEFAEDSQYFTIENRYLPGADGKCFTSDDVLETQARAINVYKSTDTYHSVSVTAAGQGSGTVASNPAGIDCGSSCTANFGSGTIVTLTATPAAGSTFQGWQGACIGAGTCVLSMSSDRAVTATFAAGTAGNQTTCATPGGRLTSGPYIVDNNTYMNSEAALPSHPVPDGQFSECASVAAGSTAGTIRASFAFDWPHQTVDAERITRATPGITYGFSPWDAASTTSDLPRRVTDIAKLQVDADVAQTKSQGAEFLFGLVAYLTTTDTKTGSDPLPFQKRLLIYPNAYPPYGDHGIAQVEIGGITWDVWSSSYYLLYAPHANQDVPVTGLHLDVARFVADGLDRGLIDPAWYVSSVSTALIVEEGSGSVALDNYKVTFEAGTPPVTTGDLLGGFGSMTDAGAQGAWFINRDDATRLVDLSFPAAVAGFDGACARIAATTYGSSAYLTQLAYGRGTLETVGLVAGKTYQIQLRGKVEADHAVTITVWAQNGTAWPPLNGGAGGNDTSATFTLDGTVKTLTAEPFVASASASVRFVVNLGDEAGVSHDGEVFYLDDIQLIAVP